jgi:hypothetical protein
MIIATVELFRDGLLTVLVIVDCHERGALAMWLDSRILGGGERRALLDWLDSRPLDCCGRVAFAAMLIMIALPVIVHRALP